MLIENEGGGGCSTSGYCGDSSGNGNSGSSNNGNGNGGNSGGGDDGCDLVCKLEEGSNWREYLALDTTPNLWPDYYIGSLFIPIYPPAPVFGINLTVMIDAYGNWYFDAGGGFSVGPSFNGGAGWLLGPDNDKEEAVKKFLQGHSVNVSVGDVFGIGINNVNPSYMQFGNEGSGIENISVEGLLTSPGGTIVLGYGWLIYDNGDDTPWIWQGD